MRLPRIQFTICHLIALVAFVGVGFGLDRAIDGRYVEAAVFAGIWAVLLVPTCLIGLMIAAIVFENRSAT